MRWLFVLFVVLVLLALMQALRFGMRLTSGGGKTCLAVQVGGLSVFRLRFGEKRPPKLKSRKERERDAAKERKKAKEEKKPKKEGELSQLLSAADDVGFLLESLKKGLSVPTERLLKRIVVSRLTIHVAVGTRDPMMTTICYGALSASVFTAVATLTHLVTVKRRDLVMVPDYGSASTTLELDIQLWLRLWHFTHAAAGYLALWREIKAILKQRAATKTEQSEACNVS